MSKLLNTILSMATGAIFVWALWILDTATKQDFKDGAGLLIFTTIVSAVALIIYGEVSENE